MVRAILPLASADFCSHNPVIELDEQRAIARPRHGFCVFVGSGRFWPELVGHWHGT